jgi:hypothetical protein
MNNRKLLLIMGIAAIMLIFTVGTSFAASSEKLYYSDTKEVMVYNQKIVTVL